MARACARGTCTCTALTQIIPNLLFRSSQRFHNAVRRLRSRRGGLATRSETMPSGRANCDAATATTWECQRAICSANHTLALPPRFRICFFGHRASIWPASKHPLLQKHSDTHPPDPSCPRASPREWLSVRRTSTRQTLALPSHWSGFYWRGLGHKKRRK